jgi:RES domain-containing protein
VSVQRLDRTLIVYRIGDPEGAYKIFDAGGSRVAPGRWNTPDAPVIYASEHYSTAMLEKLVHAQGLMPPNQHYISITLPHGLSFEMLTKDHLPGWDAENESIPQAHGRRWVLERRSATLFVPSFVARVEQNILINPEHEEFVRIENSLPVPIWWDQRLFDG